MKLDMTHFALIPSMLAVLLLLACAAFAAQTPKEAPKVTIKVVANGDSVATPAECHAVLVGPGVNQPDPFPGYGGFVGWESPIRLKDGTMIVGFSAGYWHGSPPTPISGGEAEGYIKIGMPVIDAPRGGRAMLVRSTDNGKTWSKPETIVDSPWDDRHPAFVEALNGTIIATFFEWALGDKGGAHSVYTRSTDKGRTWSEPKRLPSPFSGDEIDGPLVLAKDGSIYAVIDGAREGSKLSEAAVLRSTDNGKTWKILSTLKTDHDMYELSLAQLHDGSMAIIARKDSDIAWSYDGGKTWTPFATLGWQLYAPSLLTLKDGTLLSIHGSYAAGGLRCTFSRDGGKTWIAPNEKYGFLIDNTYGYGKGTQLPDGSIWITYIKSGGHSPEDAKTNAVMNIRMRIRPDYSGIDLLPAPNK